MSTARRYDTIRYTTQRYAAALFLTVCGFVPLVAQSAESKPEASPTVVSAITVISDNNYAPYVFYGSDGELQGILVDQWKAWERATGIKVTVRGMPWAEAQLAFNEGQGDVLDTVFVTEERKKLYSFSGPYATIRVPIFIRRSISGIAGVSDLGGFRVAVKDGDAAVTNLYDSGVQDLAFFRSYEDIIKAAAQNDVRIFCVDEPPALYYMYKFGIDRDFRIAFILNHGEFHRAVRKGSETLLRLVERGFESIPRETIEEIDRKWLGVEIARVIDFGLVGAVAALLASLILFLLVTAWLLRRQVTKATRELSEKVRLLEASEARNRAFISLLPDIIFTMDRAGVFLETSTRDTSVLMYPPHAFLGRSIATIGFPPEVVTGFMDKLLEALDTSSITTYVYELPGTDGMNSYEGRIVPIATDSALLVVRDITEQKKQDALLRVSLLEKEVLLKEIHHRVKNNMQVISSLIQLQSYAIRDDTDRELLYETQSRINAMAAIHELLYQSPDLSSVDIGEYLNSVLDELAISYKLVDVQFSADYIKVSLDEAMPLGLITNELVLNSLKYGHGPNGRGSITVAVKRIDNDVSLVVKDQGAGLPPDIDPMTSSTMGFTLVRSLAAQLKGTLSFGGPPGFEASLRFSVAKTPR